MKYSALIDPFFTLNRIELTVTWSKMTPFVGFGRPRINPDRHPDQSFSERRRPRRPGSLKPSCPSLSHRRCHICRPWHSWLMSELLRYNIGLLRTVTWNLKIQDGEDVNVLQRPDSDQIMKKFQSVLFSEFPLLSETVFPLVRGALI